MEVDIEDLTGKKKRQNSCVLPHSKKKLCLSENKTSGQTKLNFLKSTLISSNSLSGNIRSKENNELNSYGNVQEIEESSTSPKTRDKYLQVFHNSKATGSVLNERKINFYFKRVDKHECSVKPVEYGSVKRPQEKVSKYSVNSSVSGSFNCTTESVISSEDCIQENSDSVTISGILNNNTTTESVTSSDHIYENSDSVTSTNNLNNAFLESDLQTDSSLLSECPQKSYDEKNSIQNEECCYLSKLKKNDIKAVPCSELEYLCDNQCAVQMEVHSVVSIKNVKHNTNDTVKDTCEGVNCKEEKLADNVPFDQIQSQEENYSSELESCESKVVSDSELKKSEETGDSDDKQNTEDAEETETGENIEITKREVVHTDNSHGDLNDLFEGSFDNWDFSEMLCPNATNDLDLSSWQRCKVLCVDKDCNSKNMILTLQSISAGNTSKCILQGVWKFSNINLGSVVYAKAHFQRSESAWVIDNDNGFIVEHPDVLISPTSIVGSISCMRQGVLNYLICKADTDENSKCLVSGSLIHEFLQQVLSQRNNSPEFIATIIEEIITSPYNIRLLYSSRMSLYEARLELLNAVPNLQRFCQFYSAFCVEKGSDLIPKENDAWKGKIKSVIAVEDNYWIPQLGLKGKVDVTVSALEDLSQERLMPLELKTGSAKNSVEHRGQVILYCLMAAEITPEIDGGLLVYLREGFARKVLVGRREQRDIVLLRNQLMKYLAPQPPSENSSLGSIVLPDPIGSSQICKWCPHTTICAAFLRALQHDNSQIKGKAHDLRNSSLTHLSSGHINYVVHWCRLLWEEERGKPEDSLKDLWTINPENREKKGVCLSNLILCPPVNCKDHSYFHVLKKKNEDKIDFSSHKFALGQTVLVSTDRRLAIAFGIVMEINSDCLILDIPRDLSQNCDLYGDTFTVDVYEPKSRVNWCIGNLASLLDDKEESFRLRRLIIDLDKPLFEVNFETSELNLNSSLCLNTSQQMAIKKAVATQDYLLIRGYPGSGKSFTVAALIQELVSRGLSVLLTAHTHSAVDTVLLKLLNLKVDFMRIGAVSRIHESINPWSEHNLTKHIHTPRDLETTYKEKPVIATTCWGIKHTLFSRRTFDVCIVDESTQVLQPVIVGPLLRAKRFILVGDPEQLPPVVKSKIASKEGLSKCMFTRLDKLEASVQLDIQYRMNSKITELANYLTYDGKLKCASLAVANATLSLTVEKQAADSQPPWVSRSLCCKLEASVIFINIPKIETTKAQLINKEEALVAKELVESFVGCGIAIGNIGVMAPYCDQVKYLQSVILTSQNVEINTVDQYQGRDKDIVIFSCTNNWSTNKSSSQDRGILNDRRRMTVAITRAKVKFIMIGNKEVLRAFAPFRLIIDFIDPSNIFEVKY